jgi:hypothetical protein
MKNKMVYLMAFLAMATVSSAMIQVVGGDAGQGLTLDASKVVGALNVGGHGAALDVQGITFHNSDTIGSYTGPLTWAGGASGGSGEYGGAFVFGAGETSANDTNLAGVFRSLYFGSNWMQITVGGLTANATYKFDVLASCTQNFNARSMVISANGTDMETFSMLRGDYAYVVSFQAAADGLGKMVIGAHPGSEGGFFNGLVVSTPEPATMALLGLGALLGLKRKR